MNALTIEITPQALFKVTLPSGQVILFEHHSNMIWTLERETKRLMVEATGKEYNERTN